jgi:5'(3')-deoxyribonucleotidase
MNMDYKTDQTHDRICYVDMDGVIADFDKKYFEISGKLADSVSDQELWKAIETHGKAKFFAEMPWMPDGKTLWNYVNQNFLKVKILTALGKTDAVDGQSTKGKREWLRHNIPALSDSDIIMVRNRHQKKRYSSPQSIIIDDTPVVIEEWTQKGGIGILHTSAAETIGILKEYV